VETEKLEKDEREEEERKNWNQRKMDGPSWQNVADEGYKQPSTPSFVHDSAGHAMDED